jgi:hypothetical protein
VRSEIPQLDVVTAIGDAEAEDYVAQLLFSQGWNIVYRAFDMASLEEFISNRPSELRTVLVFRKDISDFDIGVIDTFLSPSLTMISLDGIAMSAHQVMQHIRTQLRLPLIVTQNKKIEEVKQTAKFETILITGTAGSPGRSTLAVNLALESNLPLIDLDFRSPSLEYLIDRGDLDIELLNLSEEKPREYLPSSSAILDIGPLPPLGEMVNDRRWQAALLNSSFDSATKLVYICKANGLSLIRLQKFIEDFPILLRKIPIIYILNLAGNSREERAMERSFGKIVAGETSIVISSDARIANPSKSGNKVIGKLSALIH